MTHIISGSTTVGGNITITLNDGVTGDQIHTVAIQPIDMTEQDLTLVDGAVDGSFTTSAVFGANGFFGIDTEDGYFENITASGNDATVNEYEFDGDLVADYTETGITFADSNSDGIVDSVTSSWGTEELTFANARAVTSINGVATTGLNAVDVTFTMQTPKTVETTTDWWQADYMIWDEDLQESVLVTDLNTLESMFIDEPWGRVYMESNTNEQVKLLGDGSVVAMEEDGSVTTWTDDGGTLHYDMGVVPTTTVVGSWTNDTTTGSDGMLTVTLTTGEVTAFKVDSVDGLVQTSLPAAGYTETDTWYYGVDLATFADMTNYIASMDIQSDGTNYDITLVNEVSLDLSDLVYNNNLASIDAENDVINSITLTAQNVLDMGVDDTLYLDVDAKDTLDLSTWAAGTVVDVDGKAYDTYTSSTATLYINTDDTVVPA